jgi:exosome complex component RRP45
LITEQKEVQLLDTFKPMSVHFIPIVITMGFFDGGNIIVLDPTITEEAIMEGKVSVCMNIYGDIVTISKTGGACLDPSLLF